MIPKHEKKRGVSSSRRWTRENRAAEPLLLLSSFFNSQIGKDPQSPPHHFFLLGRIYLWIGFRREAMARQAPVEEKVRIASPSPPYMLRKSGRKFRPLVASSICSVLESFPKRFFLACPNYSMDATPFHPHFTRITTLVFLYHADNKGKERAQGREWRQSARLA